MLLVAAAIYLERRLVQVALASWLVFATPHLVFHLGQTQHFSLRSNAEQLGGLVLIVVLPLFLLLFALPSRRHVRFSSLDYCLLGAYGNSLENHYRFELLRKLMGW